ncbi:uncharacterized protein [Clytia hemisphaerica]|uniref:uncharacterized protein isoform X3 n=1 Tax=Clytia hemisphaerica TaxID=252671 RepID=UPI0034D3E5AC|eukprot:TCONS_00016231-protein
MSSKQTGVGQILSTGSEKEESSQENAKNSKVEVATQGEDRILNTLKKSEKEKLQACLDKEGSHLKNWRQVVDKIFENDEDNSKAIEIKATIENIRFGGGAAGGFLKKLEQKLPDLTVGTLNEICKEEGRNDIVKDLKRFKEQQKLFEVLDADDISKLNVKMDDDEFCLIVAESEILEKVAHHFGIKGTLFSQHEKDNIKAIGPGKFQSCTVSLLDILNRERSDMTVKELAKICEALRINDAKDALLKLLHK